MKTRIFIFLILSNHIFGQDINFKNDHFNAGVKLRYPKIEHLSTKQINSYLNPQIGQLVFDTDLKKTLSWNGEKWANSTLAPCVEVPCSEEGGGGGGGGTNLVPPTISTSATLICSSQNNLFSNKTSSVLTSTSCGGVRVVVWYRSGDIEISRGTNSITVSPTTTNTYYATCAASITSTYESMISNSITITKNFTPSISPTLSVTPSENIIAGTFVDISVTGCQSGDSPYWETFGIQNSIHVQPLSTTIYRASCSKNECSSNYEPKTINVTRPTISSTTNNICLDTTTKTLNASTLTINNCNGPIFWSTGSMSSSINVQPSVTTTYTANCRVAPSVVVTTNSIVVKVTASPSIIKTSPNASTYLLTASCPSGMTYLWNTNVTTSSISVSNSLPKTYIAYCVDNGCLSQGTIHKINLPPIIASNQDVICQSQSLVLTATECDGIVNWYRSTNSPSNFANVGTGNPHTYSVPTLSFLNSVLYKAVCINSGTSDFSNIITITVNNGTLPSPPSITSVPATSIINQGDSVSLTASGCGSNSIKWISGETSANIVKKPVSTVMYSAYCFNGTCPSNLTNRFVTVVNVPPPTVSAPKDTICEGQNLVVSAAGCNGQVNWYSVPLNDITATPSFLGVGININIQMTSSLIIKATCSDFGVISSFSQDFIVHFSPNPMVINSIDNDLVYGAVFQDESLVLTSYGCSFGDTYLWDYNNLTTQSISVSPMVETHFIAKCTNSTCTTIGKNYFVKVCPNAQSFTAPNNINSTPIPQLSPSKIINASNKIKNSNTKAIFQASESILLNPGFSAESGTIFTAQTGGCKTPSDLDN